VKTSLFSGAALKAIVDKTLTNVPPDKTMAIVTTVDEQGVNVSIAVRAGGKWTIGAALSHRHRGDLQAGASVQFVV